MRQLLLLALLAVPSAAVMTPSDVVKPLADGQANFLSAGVAGETRLV